MGAQYVYGGRNTQTFQKLHGFEKLVVWQAASDLSAGCCASALVNKIVSRLGPGYYKLADQMRSAATSVTANIAEGYCRASLGDYIRFSRWVQRRNRPRLVRRAGQLYPGLRAVGADQG